MLAARVNVDLAPVADVDSRPGPSSSNPDGARSFSGDPIKAADYTLAFLRGLRDAGVLPVVKHFPGLGRATGNPDSGPAATLPLAQLATTGLIPFRRAIDSAAPAVMVANAAVPGLTVSPSSLSARVIDGLLKRHLGFRGLVVTDSLSARSVLTGNRTLAHAAVQAIRAGADLVLFGSTLTPSDIARLSTRGLRRSFGAIVGAIRTAVADGYLPLRRLRAAVLAVSRASRDPLCS